MFDSFRGQRLLNPYITLFKPNVLPLRTPTRARRCTQSPKNGSGQTVHQMRDMNGTMRAMSKNHHRIQMNTMMILRLPTGDPMNPARMKIVKKKRFGTMTRN